MLLCGYLPFVGETNAEVLRAVAGGEGALPPATGRGAYRVEISRRSDGLVGFNGAVGTLVVYDAPLGAEAVAAQRGHTVKHLRNCACPRREPRTRGEYACEYWTVKPCRSMAWLRKLNFVPSVVCLYELLCH